MSIIDEIIDDFKFRQMYKDSLATQPWLQNNKYGIADIPGIGEGTVYTSTHGIGTRDNPRYIVEPNIMLNKENKLQYYNPDAYVPPQGTNYRSEADSRGYGIEFGDEGEANKFANWLHIKHSKDK